MTDAGCGTGILSVAAALLGFRGDLVWRNFTLGLARGSMLGGKGNAFHMRDFGKWLYGHNAYQDDKYFDFDATLKGRVLLLPIGIHGLAIILNKKVKAFGVFNFVN